MLGGGNCIDLDNYDGDISAAVPALLAEGCRYAIVGCQDPAIAIGQIAALRSGGIEVIGVYAYLYWGGDVLAETAKAVSVASRAGIPRVYLDCERDGELPGQTPETRLTQLRQAVTAVRAAGLAPGIYTGEPFWREAIGNATDFADLPLWHAAYWYDLHHVPSVNYGGWTEAAVHQYTASGNLDVAPDGSLVKVPLLAGINAGYNIAFPGGLTMTFTEAQEQRIREIATETIAVQFRALLDASFTGGFTEPDGTPLPVPSGVSTYIGNRVPPGSTVPDPSTPQEALRVWLYSIRVPAQPRAECSVKVVVNTDRCEGHARCQAFAPEVFRLDANDQSQVLMEDVPDNLRTRVEEAIRLCPRQAISWVNVT